MVYKESPLGSWGSAFGLESAELLLACLINLLLESFGALSVSVWALLQQGYLPIPFFGMLRSCRAPWRNRNKEWKAVWQREVLKHTCAPCVLGGPGAHLHVLAPISATQIHCPVISDARQHVVSSSAQKVWRLQIWTHPWGSTPISCTRSRKCFSLCPHLSCYTK
jgi:hypothetical protein